MSDKDYLRQLAYEELYNKIKEYNDEHPDVQVEIVNSLSHDIYEDLVSNLPEVSDDRLMANKPSKNVYEFLELVKNAIEKYEGITKGIVSNEQVYFTYEFPPEPARTPAIVPHIVEHMPGAFGRAKVDKAPEVREHSYHLRGIENDPEAPNRAILKLGKYYDSIVEFRCYARTNKTANALALWFEELMEDYRYYYRFEGVSNCIFIGQGEDRKEEYDKQAVFYRPLLYKVRTERIKFTSEARIRAVMVSVYGKVQNIVTEE